MQLHTIDLSSPYLNKPFGQFYPIEIGSFSMNQGNAPVGGATAKHTYIHILHEVTVKTHKTKKMGGKRPITNYT